MLTFAAAGSSDPPGRAERRRAGRQGRLFPPEDLGLLEAPDREAWQKPEQIMDALGIADGSARRRHRRRRRLVHDSAGAPRRSERHRLRAGRAAADARGDPAACRARRARRTWRPGSAPAALPNLPERTLDAVLVVDVYPEVDDGSRHLPPEPGGGAQAGRPPRHRELQAGERRTRARRPTKASASTARASSRMRAPPACASSPAQTLPYQYLLVLGR